MCSPGSGRPVFPSGEIVFTQPVLMCLYMHVPGGDNNSNLDICTLKSFISASVQSCSTPYF